MERQESIMVDHLQINPRLIQTAYDSSKYQNKTYEVLTQVFRLMNLSKISQANPADRNTKDMMKNIVNSQFIPRNFEQQPYKNKLDLSEVFPVNKHGTFGRELQRKGRFNGNKLLQFEEGKQQKPKEFKNFINKVEAFDDKNKDNKIGWIPQTKKYPYRIIIIDKSDSHKGLYFPTLQKAEQVRIFLSQNFKYTGNFPKLMQTLNKQLVDSYSESFKSKLIFRKKMINKSNRFTRNVVLEEKNKGFAESQVRPVHHQPPNTSIFYNQPSRNTSQPRENQMIKFSRLLQTKNRQDDISLRINKMRQLQSAYVVDWLQTWKLKAKSARFNNKKSSMKSIYSNNMASRLNQNKSQFGATSNLHESKKRVDNHLDKSIFKALQGSSMKESYVKDFPKQGNTEHLFCFSIEFLTLKDLFFKPIVTVEMIRKNTIQSSVIYNTIIVKKEPYLTYQLLANEEYLRFESEHLKDYDVSIRVIDFIANEEVLNDKITMKTKKIVDKASLISDNRLVKLEMGITVSEESQLQVRQHPKQVKGTVELNIPPLSEDVKSKIVSFWEKQSQSQGYYNEHNLSIYKILGQIQSPPLTWWKGIRQDDYQLYKILNNASKIIGFKMARSFTHLLTSFSIIYPDLEEMIVKILSFIITLLKPYYFPQYFNKIQKLHRAIGLEEDCEFISKINLEIVAITKLVEFQCPTLTDKLNRKNIAYGYQMIEYIYQAFSRNYSPDCLIELWNFLYQETDLLQLNMILASVALIKYYEQDLMKAKRLKDWALIMQSQQMGKTQQIIKQIASLKQKYFSQLKGDFLDQIKNIFNSKPLEPILFQFYRRQTIKIDKRKSSKEIQKKSILRKVNKQIEIDLPAYENKKYCLHICFRKLPTVGGSLTIRSNQVDYECLNHEKNRYFIIGQVSTRITLIFLDLKSNQFSSQLQLNQGVNQFTINLTSPRNPTVYKVSYIAGLLTDNQLDIFKKGKKFDHFLSPFVRQFQFLQEMNRPVQQADFLKKYDNNSSKDDLIKKIKVLFCSGTRTFNQIDFYIEQIETSDLTIEEKIKFVKILALQLSSEFSLSYNRIYQKHLFKIFLEKTGFQFDENQFECYYSDSLDNEFDSPKIIKCRYIPLNQPNKQVKLQGEALSYFINKSSKFLYSDIIIDEFISLMKGSITSQLGAFLQGDLKLLYSSNGEIYVKTWLVKLKNKNKEIEYQEIKEDTVDDIQQGEINQPQVLMTEVLPSFAKISTILDYVNSNRQVDLKAKYQDKQRKKLAQTINIIKDCQLRFTKTIAMRYQRYPEQINIPFFLYYYELTKDFSIPTLKNIYLNNLKSDIKSISLLKGTLKFGENAKVESYTYQPDIGIYGNLRLFSRDAKVWFFFSYGNEEHHSKYEQGRVFTNYGYGVFRWEPCLVVGFVNRVKPKGNSKSNAKAQPTKEYLIIYRNQQKYVKPYELQLKHGAQSRIKQIQQNGSRYRQERTYLDDEEGNNKDGSYKYLSKFIK